MCRRCDTELDEFAARDAAGDHLHGPVGAVQFGAVDAGVATISTVPHVEQVFADMGLKERNRALHKP